MFDNFKCVTRSFGSAATYVADRLEHANVEANVDDAIAISKKITSLKSEGGLACHLFNSFQKGKLVTLEIEEDESEEEE